MNISGNQTSEVLPQRLIKLASELSQIMSQADYENGNVTWTREMAIAQQKLEEVILWALKALSK